MSPSREQRRGARRAPDVVKTKDHPSLHSHGHHADHHGRPRQHRYHAHRPRRAHHQQHRRRRQQPVYDEDFDQPYVITRTPRLLDGDNGRRAAHGAIREEHGGPRAPFMEGRLRRGAALLALAELGKPLLRSKVSQEMACAASCRMV